MDQAALGVSRENEYWAPPPIWTGERAFVLASGPSLTREICDSLRGRHTIAVNSTCLLAPSAEVLFFTDSSWYETHRDIVAAWPGLVVSMAKTAKRELPDKVMRVRGLGGPGFLPVFPAPGSEAIQQGRTSGHTAVALAIAFGATEVVMLGFDMRVVAGREHCHDDYGSSGGPRDLGQYATDFVPAFAGWNDGARRAGVRVLNATPGSAVTEFPMADVRDLIADVE